MDASDVIRKRKAQVLAQKEVAQAAAVAAAEDAPDSVSARGAVANTPLLTQDQRTEVKSQFPATAEAQEKALYPCGSNVCGVPDQEPPP